MPELERYVLTLLGQLDMDLREAAEAYELNRYLRRLTDFANEDLSAFFFDIRKDSLYCDAWSSLRGRSCRTVLDQLFHCLTTWWAPVLAFTMDEVWLSRFPGDGSSVHLMQFARCPDEWAAPELAAKWDKIREVRSVVTGALEIERAPDIVAAEPDGGDAQARCSDVAKLHGMFPRCGCTFARPGRQAQGRLRRRALGA